MTLLVAANTLGLWLFPEPANEGLLNFAFAQYFGVGFYLWIASILTIGVTAIILGRQPAK
jgi:hypothetical protein